MLILDATTQRTAKGEMNPPFVTTATLPSVTTMLIVTFKPFGLVVVEVAATTRYKFGEMILMQLNICLP